MDNSKGAQIAEAARQAGKRTAEQAALPAPPDTQPPALRPSTALVAVSTASAAAPVNQRSVEKLSNTPTIGAPPALIASLKAHGRLGYELYRNQEFQTYSTVNIYFDEVVTGLAHATLDALRIMLENEHVLRINEIDDLMTSSIDVLQDIYGRALYARLKHIADMTRVSTGHFSARATFDRQTTLPNFVARALSSIGTFRPEQVLNDVSYLPSVSQDILNTGGTSAVARYPQYQHLVRIFVRLKIPLSTLDVRNIAGSGYWLLRLDRYPAAAPTRYDVLSTLPPCNFSDTDSITFLYLIKAASDYQPGHPLEARAANFIEWRSYGSLFRGINISEITSYVLAEFGVPNEEYISGIFP